MRNGLPNAGPLRPLGRRVLWYILLFSAIFALLASLVQLWSDYRSGVEQIETRLQQIKVSYCPGLVSNLWDMNMVQAQELIKGIQLLPDISHVEVVDEKGGVIIETGTSKEGSVIDYRVPLIYTDYEAEKIDLGFMHIIASLETLRRQIFAKAWIIFITQMVKTFIVSFFILMIFRKLVTRHLETIVMWAEGVSLHSLREELVLNRPSRRSGKDELDKVVFAINEMQERTVESIKDMEASLLESTKKYRQLIENISGGFILYSYGIDGVLTFISHSVESVLGLSVEESLTHISKHMSDNPINQQAVHHAELSISGKHQPPYLTELFHKDGSLRLLEVVEVPVFDSKGHVISVDGIAQDITKRKQNETALRESESRFRSLFHESIIGMALHEIILDADENPINFRFLDVNAKFEILTGLRAQDLLGRTALEVLPTLEFSWIERYGQVALTGEPVHFENFSKALNKHFEVFACRPQPMQFFTMFMDITSRKKAESALEERESQLRQIIDLVPHAIFVKDWDGRFQMVNQATADLYDMTVEELTGQQYLGMPATEKELEAFLRDDREVMETAKPKHVLKECITDAHGQTRMFDTTKIPFFSAVKKELAVLGVSIDITDRERAAEALQKNEALLRAIFEASQDIIFSKDRTSRYTLINSKGLQLLGMAPADFIGKRDNELFPDHIAHQMIETDRQVMESGKNIVYEIEIAFKTGNKTFLANKSPLKDNSGHILGVVGIAHDISDRLRAEEELKRSESMFRGLLDAFSDPLILFTKDRKILWGNESAAEYIIVDPVSRLEKMCIELCGDEINALVDACFTTGQPGVSRITTRNRVMDSRTFPIRQEEGDEVSHVFLTAMDVGEKLNLQEQALRTARLATLGVLSASIAHEINNPNNTILFNGPALQDIWQSMEPILRNNHPPVGTLNFGALSYEAVIERVPELLADITGCARRIQRIVTQLKFLVRKESGDMDEPVDLIAIIHDSVALLHHQIQKTTHRLSMDLDKEIPQGTGNAQQIEQVVINLILNALESLPDKSHGVTITLRAIRDGTCLMLMVADEGCGRTDETMRHILEPLFTTRSLSGGTGLGLAVSKEIIDRHKGTIRFESEVGKGTSVIVELPISETESSS